MTIATHQQAIETQTASGYEAAVGEHFVDALVIVNAPAIERTRRASPMRLSYFNMGLILLPQMKGLSSVRNVFVR
jgi:hypothetical protein